MAQVARLGGGHRKTDCGDAVGDYPVDANGEFVEHGDVAEVAVVSREAKAPHFQTVLATARK